MLKRKSTTESCPLGTLNFTGSPPPEEHRGLVASLRWRAGHAGESIAFRFLPDGRQERDVLTYSDLDAKARIGANWLFAEGLKGERALLLYPSSPDYLAAFLACLYAGVVAVPLPPPRSNRSLERLQAAASDAKPRAILTSSEVMARDHSSLGRLAEATGGTILAFDQLDFGGTPPADLGLQAAGSETLAFLQYTSGSTSSPKGVMVTHGNLESNCRAIASIAGRDPRHVGVSWLPYHHDMGLIGGLLSSLYMGIPLVSMPAEAFVMKPRRWLEAISRYRATLSPAPNFAYDMCVRRIPHDERQEFDLSSWRVAFNGSERVDAGSLRRFSAAFAPCGFRETTHYPCYGLAESTLIVAGGEAAEPPIVRSFDKRELHQGVVAASDKSDEQAVLDLVSCGRAVDGEILLVDPETGTRSAPGHIGEIWLRGPSVAAGYWNNPRATAETFLAHDVETLAGPFLRTGDLGFVDEDQLFIAGRLKDIIIISGHNIYPEDVEATVEAAHKLVVPHGAVAFALDDDVRERLVVVAELDLPQGVREIGNLAKLPRDLAKQVEREVAESVSCRHDVPVHRVMFVKRRTLPKTSSGKKMRAACKQAFLEQNLQEHDYC